MHYIIFILFLILALAGLISLIFGLPGNFIILAGSILYGWYGGFREITLKVIILLMALAVFGEVVEYIFGILGAKRRRASKGAIICSIVGGIVGGVFGTPFLLGIGSVIGALLGVFTGAFIFEFFEGKGVNQAVESGWGAFIGRVAGMLTKSVIGIAMVIITIVSMVRD